MRLVLDMNLSPTWVPLLEEQGWKTIHWISVGPSNSPDVEIMSWAKDRGFCVVTSDLDCSAILASTRAEGPSIIQIRGQDLSPATLGSTLIAVLREHNRALSDGAISSMDLRTARIRSLPLHPSAT